MVDFVAEVGIRSEVDIECAVVRDEGGQVIAQLGHEDPHHETSGVEVTQRQLTKYQVHVI
jgi:hypothetical protein